MDLLSIVRPVVTLGCGLLAACGTASLDAKGPTTDVAIDANAAVQDSGDPPPGDASYLIAISDPQIAPLADRSAASDKAVADYIDGTMYLTPSVLSQTSSVCLERKSRFEALATQLHASDEWRIILASAYFSEASMMKATYMALDCDDDISMDRSSKMAVGPVSYKCHLLEEQIEARARLILGDKKLAKETNLAAQAYFGCQYDASESP